MSTTQVIRCSSHGELVQACQIVNTKTRETLKSEVLYSDVELHLIETPRDSAQLRSENVHCFYRTKVKVIIAERTRITVSMVNIRLMFSLVQTNLFKMKT